MDAERTAGEDRDTPAQVEAEATGEAGVARPRITHSLMDVLMPANPPPPKNARVIRLFDYEAAKHDPHPGEAAVPAQTQKHEPTTREAAKAARNQSLLAAAGLV